MCWTMKTKSYSISKFYSFYEENELKEQGYSDKMVKELCKWYDSSKHKGVASF